MVKNIESGVESLSLNNLDHLHKGIGQPITLVFQDTFKRAQDQEIGGFQRNRSNPMLDGSILVTGRFFNLFLILGTTNQAAPFPSIGR